MEFDQEEGNVGGSRRRRLSVRHLYSSTTPCVNASGSSNVMSKKVKARKIMEIEEEGTGELGEKRGIIRPDSKPLLVYIRRTKEGRHFTTNASFFEKLILEEGRECGGSKEVRMDVMLSDEVDLVVEGTQKRRKKRLHSEIFGLTDGCGLGYGVRRRLRGSRVLNSGCGVVNVEETGCKKKEATFSLSKAKKWVELSFKDANPLAFVGLQCKVFWPMDDAWYYGSIDEYNPEIGQHKVHYKDGDDESLVLSKEVVKFHISFVEMQDLNLKYSALDVEKKASEYDEMLALSVSYDDSQEFEAKEIVWAKLSGFSMWPALVSDEAHIGALGAPKPHLKERTVPVQFFGTYDFARVNIKQVKSFFQGMLLSFHLKCKQTRFQRSLDEAKMYLTQQQLPNKMIGMQKGVRAENSKGTDDERTDYGDDSSCDDGIRKRVPQNNTCPFEIGDLQVTSLGKIVFDSEYFHNKHSIWPEGYTASRKFMSISNPKVNTFYKMEVLRNPKSKAHPLFRVTLDDGEQIEGSNPTVCWEEIYRRIQRNTCNVSHTIVVDKLQKSGSYMFGFTNSRISQLIQNLPHSRQSSWSVQNSSNISSSYKTVHDGWNDIDRCNVCHMDEDYENNLFLQCDRCRMMVHARCYGEIEPLDGVLWFCNLCRPGTPKHPPQCCLCPIAGGAIKPTTDGLWAHLACAMWIPETCLLDIKRMEPIDGIQRINKNRWKLLCSICGISYGACIQCCNTNCYVAYHPLCARASGLCLELENENQLHLLSVDEDEDQCIRLVSFCKKHRQPSNEHSPSKEKTPEPLKESLTCIPISNPSGCARIEPYNFFGRRGQKEPQVFAAASMKRLYIENIPYLVSGCHQDGFDGSACSESAQSVSSHAVAKLKFHHCDTPCSISSMGEKYQYMKTTCKKRLAFGKSRIHGFGVFAKIEHKAGDMVIEYTGELVRQPIADIREHRIYNSLVGAGTYMFRIDNEHVVDATRAGSIAHLINHSCEPNCYSRTITVHGVAHIIIFAKREINQWEELTYDYRFFSKDKQLSCFCGSTKCRGVVNDIDAEEQITDQWVPRCKLIPWREE